MTDRITEEERRRAQASCPCGGLDFPKMPHLHAEDCPAREAEVTYYREDVVERRMFDRGNDLFGGSPLRQIAMVLDTWGRANSGGSYAEQCFIMANECLLASRLLASAREQEDLLPASPAGGVGEAEALIAELRRQIDIQTNPAPGRLLPSFTGGVVLSLDEARTILAMIASAPPPEGGEDSGHPGGGCAASQPRPADAGPQTQHSDGKE